MFKSPHSDSRQYRTSCSGSGGVLDGVGGVLAVKSYLCHRHQYVNKTQLHLPLGSRPERSDLRLTRSTRGVQISESALTAGVNVMADHSTHVVHTYSLLLSSNTNWAPVPRHRGIGPDFLFRPLVRSSTMVIGYKLVVNPDVARHTMPCLFPLPFRSRNGLYLKKKHVEW